jgi:hypothetical protein
MGGTQQREEERESVCVHKEKRESVCVCIRKKRERVGERTRRKIMEQVKKSKKEENTKK